MDRAAAFKKGDEELVRMFQRYAKKIDKTATNPSEVNYLNVKDLMKIFKDHEMALNEDDVSTVFKMIDADGQGKITQDEFVSALSDRSGYPKLQDVRSLFDKIDVIKDGVIRFDELQLSMGQYLSNGLLKVIFKELDRDKSGKVTYVQFLEFFIS